MKLKPMNGKIVVKADVAESKTVGGIIIPETAKEKPTYGTVIAACDDAIDSGIDIDTRVLYEKYVGTELEIDGEQLVIMSYDDIFGILED